MTAHHAWFCSDVVNTITSFLPTADTLSLLMCGNTTFNKLLLVYTDRCLVHTTRDMEAFYSFIKKFSNIRYVYINNCYENIKPGYNFYNVERFVAPRMEIVGLKFGLKLQYMSVRKEVKCRFRAPPEILVTAAPLPNSNYMTHSSVNMESYIYSYTDEEFEQYYLRMKELVVYGCPLSPKIRTSSRVKFIYICGGDCQLCGKIRSAAVTRPVESYDVFSGASAITIAGIIDKHTCYTIPSSVTKFSIVSVYLESKLARSIASKLPDTITDIELNVYEITSGLLKSFNKNVKTITLFCKEADHNIIASNCHKFQFDSLYIHIDDSCTKLSKKSLALLVGNYYRSGSPHHMIFERIRARK